MEINAIEDAGRAAMAWAPDPYERRIHFGIVLGAAVPAIGILVAAAVLLFVAL